MILSTKQGLHIPFVARNLSSGKKAHGSWCEYHFHIIEIHHNLLISFVSLRKKKGKIIIRVLLAEVFQPIN